MDLQSYTLPVSYAIKRLKENDFALETRDKVCLYEDACALVLFYTESIDSKKILNVFKTVAETVTGPVFAACNVLLERRVAECFIEIHNMKDHPFSWIGARQFPSIIIYRRGYPIYFYDGPADVQILTNFALNFVCTPEFNIHNLPLIEKVKAEMWSHYKMKNPLILGGPVNDEENRKNNVLPAVPYNRLSR